jgi:hypothetical protein
MERTYDAKRSKGLRVEMWEAYHHLADQLSGIAFRSTYINRKFALESIDKEIAALYVHPFFSRPFPVPS